MNVILWILQILLAMLFLFAGGLKLWVPASELAQAQQAVPNAVALSPWFLKFIGLCEVLGALGLVLPQVSQRNKRLVPLAALGLLIIMIGAVVIGFMQSGFRDALLPLVTGLLLAFIAYGRREVRP
jgi:uncharacterized membrane protein